MCPFQPYRTLSHSASTLDYITHVEIQRNLENSQKTVVNSEGSLTNVVNIMHTDAIRSHAHMILSRFGIETEYGLVSYQRGTFHYSIKAIPQLQKHAFII